MSTEKYTRDTYAFNIIGQLINNDSYLPHTRSALAPFSLANILNDIVLNQRKNILEFGCGISTIYLCRLLKREMLETKLISIDHDLSWISYVQTQLNKEKLSQHVRLIHSPLTKCSFSLDDNLWYDVSILNIELKKLSFDSIIVDGPPAWEVEKKLARYPALPFVMNRLCEKSVIFLDDAEREGEKVILQNWSEQFNLQFETPGKTLAYTLFGGDNYDFEI